MKRSFTKILLLIAPSILISEAFGALEEIKTYNNKSLIIKTYKLGSSAKFNGIPRENLLEIVVMADRLEITKNSINGQSFPLDKPENYKKISFIANDIVIKDTIHLPKTDITIKSMNFEFKDKYNQFSRIITTPLAMLEAKVPPKIDSNGDGSISKEEFEASRSSNRDGAVGENGGNIRFYVDNFKNNNFSSTSYDSSDGSISKRFVVTGGKGQKAANGLNGRDGTSFSIASNLLPGIIHYTNPNGQVTTNVENKKCPTNGWDAIPSGKPGLGGRGGNFYHNFQSNASGMNAVANLGGDSAEHSEAQNGGTPGLPRKAVWAKGYHHINSISGLSVDSELRANVTHTCDETVRGKDFRGQQPDAKRGAEGFIKRARRNVWYSPELIQFKLYKGISSYKQGKSEDIKEALVSFESGLKELREAKSKGLFVKAHPSKIENFNLYESKFVKYIAQIKAQKDFMGYAINFVPWLSQKASEQIYKDQINKHFEVLELVTLLESAELEKEKRIEKIMELRTKLKGEVTKNINVANSSLSNVNSSTEKIMELEKLEAEIQHRIAHKDEYFKWKGEKEEEKQENKLKEQRLLKTATAAMKVIPVYQPALSAAAETIEGVYDTANTIHSQDGDLDKVKTGLKFLKAQIKDKDWKKIRKESEADLKKFKENFKKEKPLDEWAALEGDEEKLKKAKRKYYLNKIKENGKFVYDSYKKTKDLFMKDYEEIKKIQVDKNAISKYVSNLKSEDKQYNEFKELLAQYVNKKAALSNDINAMYSSYFSSVESLISNSAASDALNYAMISQQTDAEVQVFKYMKDLKESSENNLLRNYYYFMKSYEYQTLTNSDINYDINQLFNDMQETLIKYLKNGNGKLNNSELKSLKTIYDQAINEAQQKLFASINEGEELGDTSQALIPLSVEQLEVLNSSDFSSIVLDLENTGHFKGEENVRIKSIEIYNMDFDEQVDAQVKIRIYHEGRAKVLYTDRESGAKSHKVFIYGNGQPQQLWSFECLENSDNCKNKKSNIRSIDEFTNAPITSDAKIVKPGARALIRVKKTVKNADIVLKSLKLKVEYEYQGE